MNFEFQALPPELQSTVFALLAPQDLCSSARVCKEWQKTIDDVIWKYLCHRDFLDYIDTALPTGNVQTWKQTYREYNRNNRHLGGLYVGKYGSHGWEAVEVRQHGYHLRAVKITGDDNIPARCPTWEMIMNREMRAGRGRVRIADVGYRKPRWTSASLLVLDDDTLNVVWHPRKSWDRILAFKRVRAVPPRLARIEEVDEASLHQAPMLMPQAPAPHPQQLPQQPHAPLPMHAPQQQFAEEVFIPAPQGAHGLFLGLPPQLQQEPQGQHQEGPAPDDAMPHNPFLPEAHGIFLGGLLPQQLHVEVQDAPQQGGDGPDPMLPILGGQNEGPQQQHEDPHEGDQQNDDMLQDGLPPPGQLHDLGLPPEIEAFLLHGHDALDHEMELEEPQHDQEMEDHHMEVDQEGDAAQLLQQELVAMEDAFSNGFDACLLAHAIAPSLIGDTRPRGENDEPEQGGEGDGVLPVPPFGGHVIDAAGIFIVFFAHPLAQNVTAAVALDFPEGANEDEAEAHAHAHSLAHAQAQAQAHARFQRQWQ